MNIREAIARLVDGHSLSEDDADAVMGGIMEGQATPAQIGAFLVALRMKGERPAEVAGCARAMRRHAIRIEPPPGQEAMDTCGTGGDRSHTINISTAAAIVVAAAGVPVAKHGNRSVSSKSGSADVLEALGVPVTLSPGQAQECLHRAGIAFLFAPTFHPAMRYAQGPRRELEIRTIFNILGPLTNPAGATYQLVGVYAPHLVELVAEALQRLGVRRALVVHSRDGTDELTLSAPALAAWVEGETLRRFELDPQDVGLPGVPREALQGGDARENAQILLGILSGEQRGPRRDVVLLNAAAALWVAGRADNLREGLGLAGDLVDSGKALAKLQEFVSVARSLAATDGAAAQGSASAPAKADAGAPAGGGA